MGQNPNLYAKLIVVHHASVIRGHSVTIIASKTIGILFIGRENKNTLENLCKNVKSIKKISQRVSLL